MSPQVSSENSSSWKRSPLTLSHWWMFLQTGLYQYKPIIYALLAVYSTAANSLLRVDLLPSASLWSLSHLSCNISCVLHLAICHLQHASCSTSLQQPIVYSASTSCHLQSASPWSFPHLTSNITCVIASCKMSLVACLLSWNTLLTFPIVLHISIDIINYLIDIFTLSPFAVDISTSFP